MKRIVLDEEATKALPSSTTTAAASLPSRQTPKSPSQAPIEDELDNASSGPRQLLPQELMGILVPSLKAGALGGTCGIFFGATAGIIRTSTPVLFSLIAGGQWFALTSSFWAARQVALRKLAGDGEIRPGDKLKASTIAGTFAGTVGGLLRGPRNILPGAVMFTIWGGSGQAIINWYQRRKEAKEGKEGKGFLHSKWSPLTPLSNQEYEDLLEEKLLFIDAQIAVIDDQIKEVRAAAEAAKSRPPSSEQNPPKTA